MNPEEYSSVGRSYEAMKSVPLPPPHAPLTTFDWPRRRDLRRMIPVEKKIRELIGEVEELGAHESLTDAVVSLSQAQEHVADWYDEQNKGKSFVVCRLCGKGAHEIGGWLSRVNEKGVKGIWECRPSCGAKLGNDEKVIAAIEGSGV